MNRIIRSAIAITLGAGALPLTGCTVSDVSDRNPAAGSASASASSSPASTLSIASGSDAARPAGAGTVMPAAAETSTPNGTLSPDSVDVGRTAPPDSLRRVATDSVPRASADSVGLSATVTNRPLRAADSVHVTRRSKADSARQSRMRLEVDLTARKLYVYDGDARVATQSIAVGSPQWPTQTGQWNVKQVVWNPEWIPPDETWAEQRTRKQPGAPDNPLGRAQLVYDPPRTIHGTNEPASIGKAVSHGSIRLPNAVVVSLGRQLMEASGVGKDDAWYRRVQQNRTEKVVVDLPQRVPIRVF